MTKRFTSDKWQVYDNDKVITVDETVDLLNSLSEENEQLKKNYAELDTLYAVCASEKVALEIENSCLKQTIREAYESERTSLGKSVLKQLLESIGDIL